MNRLKNRPNVLWVAQSDIFFSGALLDSKLWTVCAIKLSNVFAGTIVVGALSLACSSGTPRAATTETKPIPSASGGSGGSPADSGTDASTNPDGFDDSYPGVSRRVDLNFNLDWKYAQGDATGADAVAFDDTSWSYVDLPHTTKFVTPEDPNAYLGISWYRKHFSLSGEYRGSKVFIEFEAAMQVADVWINGTHRVVHYVGDAPVSADVTHYGGYAPFTLDITQDVYFGGKENTIAVKIDSRSGLTWPPGQGRPDFQYHGGLYRDVHLHVMNPVHVTDAVYANKPANGGVFVTFPSVSADSATVSIKTNVVNESKDPKTVEVTSELIDMNGQLAGSTASSVELSPATDAAFAQEIIVANPHLWHPNTPYLYSLRTTVRDEAGTYDDISTRIGIRHIRWTHDSCLEINGERFAATGVNVHQELYGVGNAVPNRSAYYEVKRIKDGGMSFIRASHYPHDPAFYDACDALGVIVLNPQTGWQYYQDGKTFKGNTYQELRDLMRRDRNHPSIVAWEASLNESDFTDTWAQTTHAIVHEEYPGDQAYSAQWKGSRSDIQIGASQSAIRSSKDSRPIIIDEYGDWDFGGADSTSRQAREAGDVAMLTQANNIEKGTSDNHSLSWYGIGSYWDFADYAGFSDYGMTLCGLVDMYQLPKFSYYFMQSQRDPNLLIDGIDSGPMVFIANHWTSTSPTTVRAYGNCDQVSLYINDALFATQAPDTGTSTPHPPFNFAVGTFAAGTLRAECLIGGITMASHQQQTPGMPAAIRLRPEATDLNADLSDARLVFIDIVDANDTVVPTDESEVSLSISGPASIVGPSVVTMKGGQLATWVRSGRSPGTITLTASQPGLLSASAELTSTQVDNLPPAPADR